MTRKPPRRGGFTLTEFAAGMVLFAVVGSSLALVNLQTARERMRTDARSSATDAAADLLELARTLPAAERTAAWASQQKLSPALASILPEGRLQLRVEAAAENPKLQRIQVQIDWLNPGGIPARPVLLTAYFATEAGATP
jgi:Tfp pilus assembly protein FimT